MIEFLEQQLIFYLYLILVLFLPGYFLVLAVFGKSRELSSLEKLVVIPGLSIVILDFLLFSYAGLDILINKYSVLSGISGICLVLFLVYKKMNFPLSPEGREGNSFLLFSFSKNQFVLILLLIFITVFIKTYYLSLTITPTATDFGHHLYWAKYISINHQLPDYEGMPDFIIGEHTVFGMINILTGIDFTAGWPVIILYLINLLSILTVFISTLRIFKNQRIAILTLLFLGVIYAISSPQTKYVSGGVIGNIFGNYLMPLAFYFYFQAFEFLNKSSISVAEIELPQFKKFLSFAVFTTIGLFYTHHLTSFIFLFVMLFAIFIFFATNLKDWRYIFKNAGKLVLSPSVLSVLIIGLIFFFFVFTPTYVNPSAVDTAVGAPVKSTRTGMTLDAIRQTAGEARFALGALGFLILLIGYRRKNLGYALLVSWTVMIFAMVYQPDMLFIDLPNNRVGNYLSYPLAILSAYGLFTVFRPESCRLIFKNISLKDSSCVLANNFLRPAFLITLTFVLATGVYETATSFKKNDNYSEASQTFAASEYLAKNTDEKDKLLKDHNYLTADTWMKLSFMRGYKYPESRGNFSRYEDKTKPREMCTLYMISNPAGSEAQKCFSETGTNFLIVNPLYDSAQFRRLGNFDQVYESSEIAIFRRKN